MASQSYMKVAALCYPILRAFLAAVGKHRSGEPSPVLYQRWFRDFARSEVSAVRVMEDQRAHAGLRFHHHAFREMDADIIWPEQLPNPLLIIQIGARRIAEAVA